MADIRKTKDIETLLETLKKEKFGGTEPKWREGEWCGRILAAEDAQNWYYKKRDIIIVQPKEGEQNKKPYCYGCDSPIKLKEQSLSVHDSPIPLTGSGCVKRVSIAYCPRCE